MTVSPPKAQKTQKLTNEAAALQLADTIRAMLVNFGASKLQFRNYIFRAED